MNSDSRSPVMAVPVVAIVAGAVLSLLLGVYGATHEPTFQPIATLGFGSLIAMKVWLAVIVGVQGVAS